MSLIVPDGYICCENCYEHFISYVVIHSEIDADSKDNTVTAASDGTLNKITCPYCMYEFTYETPLYIHSYVDKFAIISTYHDFPVKAGSFRLANIISGAADWSFRRCTFSPDAFEKMRIFKSGLSDAKIEYLKLKTFPDYRDMQLDAEYITFENIADNFLMFTKRECGGMVLENYKINVSCYNELKDISVQKGDWVTIDRDWAIKYMEENK